MKMFIICVIFSQGIVCTLHEGDDFGKLALVNDSPRLEYFDYFIFFNFFQETHIPTTIHIISLTFLTALDITIPIC